VIENGYTATSVDQVIAASGSSKGAFFHHFDSKRDLARELVGRYVDADLAHLQGALDATSSIADPAKRALAFVKVFEDAGDELMAAQSGCLYTSVLSERELNVDSTAAEIRRAVLEWRTAYADLLRAALGRRARSIDVDALSDHLFVTFEGAFLLCRSLGEPSHMRAQLRTYRVLLEGLLARRG
jgi:TetR/AcrR family transcriptional repressor of nem operon